MAVAPPGLRALRGRYGFSAGGRGTRFGLSSSWSLFLLILSREYFIGGSYRDCIPIFPTKNQKVVGNAGMEAQQSVLPRLPTFQFVRSIMQWVAIEGAAFSRIAEQSSKMTSPKTMAIGTDCCHEDYGAFDSEHAWVTQDSSASNPI